MSVPLRRRTESGFGWSAKGQGTSGVALACRTGVLFCVFQANRGESEASAKRELRARGGALKNP